MLNLDFYPKLPVILQNPLVFEKKHFMVYQ